MANVLSNDPPILYELLVYEEWTQEPEPVKCYNASPPAPASFPLSPQRIIKYLKNPDWPSEELINAVSPLLPWHIAVSPNGQMVAILQDAILEVRSQEDDFTSTIGKVNVQKDPFPPLRILKWHPESTKIVIGSSNGGVSGFDAYCNHLFSIPQKPTNNDDSPRAFVAGIEFITSRPNLSEQLLIIYSNGNLKSFAIPERDILQEKDSAQLDIKQISCAIYSRHFDVIFIASQPQPTTKFFQDTSLSAGLSAWRIVSEYPYYRMLFPNEDEYKLHNSGGKLWRMLHYSKSLGIAIKMCISQNNKYLASLHSCNTIIIWLIPSLRMFQKWTMDDTALDVTENIENVDNAPVDIDWRHDEKLIVSRKDGSISVHNAETFELCYGSGSQLLSGYPRISSTENFPGFVSLECDSILLSPSTEEVPLDIEKSILDTSSEFIQNTIFYITDIESFQPRKKSTRIVQKIYRMIGVRSTTPEELFWRKLDGNDYYGALELAEEFGLNSDEVYKKLWRSSVVSSASISESLSKIKNTSWVLNECIQRVPESISGAEDLFKFVIQITSLTQLSKEVDISQDGDSQSVDLDELCELDREKIKCRAIMFNYIDKLRAYQTILGGDPDKDGTYDIAQYGRFRRLPVVESAVYFARQCHIRAVETLFNHYPREITPYWLNILDNIPEVYSPSNYCSLLPKCDRDGRVVLWQGMHNREKDWVETDRFKNLILFQMEEASMKDFCPIESLTADILTNWYSKRAFDIEFQSNIVSNSLTLVQLAIERNIKGLEILHSNLVTLECMVYELELDSTLSSLLNMNDLQKCTKMLEKIDHDKFTSHMLDYILPYLSVHQVEGEAKFELIHDLLLHFSKNSLRSSLSFIDFLINGNHQIVGGPDHVAHLIIDCIYSYTLLDMIDESLEVIDSCLELIVSLSENTGDWTDLRKKLNVLRGETSAAKILADYKIPISIQTAHSIKTDSEEIKKVLENVGASVVRGYVRGGSPAKISTCLNDIQTLHELCFDAVSLEECYEIFASSLLHSHNLSLIKLSKLCLCSRLEIEERCCLGFEQSVQLVLQAAQKYFDLSENVNDESMKLARACLFLIKDEHQAINEELDLIQALGHFNEIGIHLIPIQVRLSEDRLKLVCMCLEKKKHLYSKPQFVYKLAAKLRVCGDEVVQRHNIVTKLLAEIALEDGADLHCMEFCKDLVTNNYSQGWEVVYQLLKKGTQGDPLVKKLLWIYCSIHAPSSLLKELFTIRRLFRSTSSRRTIDFIRSSTYGSSLADTPDSEDADDFHLASSDSSHKLDESSDAEAVPSYTTPYFYAIHSEYQGEQSSDYRIVSLPYISHPLYHILHVWSEENILPFVESRTSSMDSWLIDSKLIELAGKYMSKDTLTAVGYLLCTIDPLTCEDFFHNLSQVSFTQELATYFFAYCSVRGCERNVWTSPSQLVRSSIELSDSPFKPIISKFRRKLDSLVQAESLKEENCGVNYERFIEDDTYKTDTIFGLAMSPEKLNIAFELAKKNNIPLIDIAITYLESLFLGDNLDLLLKSSDNGDEVHNILKSSPDTVQRFQRYYEAIDGRDYKKLTNFFKIILYLDDQHVIDSLGPKEHIKLLKRIESTVPGIDYKGLVSKSEDILNHLRPYLNSNEAVSNCVKFTRSLPKNLKTDFSIETIYYEFSLIQFNTMCMNCQSLKQCVGHFESILPNLAKVDDELLLKFVQQTICSHDAVKNLDSAYRRQLLVSMLQWYSNVSRNRSNFDELSDYLHKKIERLDIVWNDDINEESLAKPRLRAYFCQLETYDSVGMENERIDYLFALLEKISTDSELSTSEKQMLKRAISSLEPLVDALHNDSPTNVVEDSTNETNEKPNELCDENSSPEIGEDDQFPPDYRDQDCKSFNETSGSETTAFLENFLSIIKKDKPLAGHDCSPTQETLSAYMAAISLMGFDLQPDQLQVVAQTVHTALRESDVDKIFLVWLCLTWKELNLGIEGESFLKLTLDIECLADYLDQHHEVHHLVVPALARTSSYTPLVAQMLEHDRHSALESFVGALKQSGLVVEAGTLLMYIKKAPSALKTFGSSMLT